MDKSKQDDSNDRDCYIIQVVNISPHATLAQITTLFDHIDEIKQIKLYQVDKDPYNFGVCYIEFSNPTSTNIAKHLTNLVFIDRPLIVLSYNCDIVPDEEENLKKFDEFVKYATIFNPNVQTHVLTGAGGIQMFATTDPKLAQNNVAPYPNLPITTDPSKIEEIRRTLYIGNLDSTVPVDQVMEFFSDIGEVKYIRLAGNENQPTRFAFVEYYNQASIASALTNNGTILGTKTLKINHSNNAIVKILHQPKLLPTIIDNRKDDSKSAGSSYRDDRYTRSDDRYRSRSRDHLSRDRGTSGSSDSRDRHHRHKNSSRDRVRDIARHRNEPVKRYNDRRDRPHDRDGSGERHRDLSRDDLRAKYKDKGRDKMDREWNRDRNKSRDGDSRSRRSRSRSGSGSRDGGSRKRHRRLSPTRHKR